jgi:hypothetical protein
MLRRLLVMSLLCAVSFLLAGGCRQQPEAEQAGPQWQPGLSPSKLGWGEDTKPYPDRFVVYPQDGSQLV